MIRVKLLSEAEYWKMRAERTCREYCEHDFFDLLREKGDFTDGDSCLLLRTLHGENAVAGKWYRRVTPEGRPCLPALSQEAKYGLVVLENSRNGIYTDYVRDFSAFEVDGRMDGIVGVHRHGGTPLVWDAFAAMDADILLVFRKKEFDFGWDIPLENGFILENYPGDDGPREVWVCKRRGKETEHNGMPCVNNSFYKLQYDWRKESGELLETLRELNGHGTPLARGLFSLPEFYRMVGERDWVCGGSSSWGKDDGTEAQESVQVLNHMDYRPAETEARRLNYLIIDKRVDGSYCLRSKTSEKYPTYEEMLGEAMDLAIPNGETLVLPVDVEEIMMCAGDIDKAACAFRMAGNMVETFGEKEGLLEFEKLLREALDSGRCALPEED